MLDNPEYTLGIRARYGEAGTDGKIRLGALANWFQEAAGHNASALGFGDERLFAEGKTWILTRMAFRIKDLPSPGDRVNVRTWPAKLEHLGHRGYEVYSPSGDLVVAAVSAWTVMDLAARRLTSLPEHLAALYPVKTLPCIPFSSRTIPRLREGIRSADVLVRRDDLDINGHASHLRYIDWCCNIFGTGIMSRYAIPRFRIAPNASPATRWFRSARRFPTNPTPPRPKASRRLPTACSTCSGAGTPATTSAAP